MAHSSCHLLLSVRMVKPETQAENEVSSAVASSNFSLMTISVSDSREVSQTVPVQTPDAPREMAPARCRPVVMPPAARIGVSPAIAATWAGFIIFAIGAAIIVENTLVLKALLDPMWLIAVVIVGPLMALMAVNASIMISSRVTDPRVAEQLSMVVIVPVLALFFGQISGLFFINSNIILIIAVILILVDILLVYLAVKVFQRENILTRWK